MRLRRGLVLPLMGFATLACADWNWHLTSTYDWNLNGAWGDAMVTNIIFGMEGQSADNSYWWGAGMWSGDSNWHPVSMTFDTYWFNHQAAEPTLTGSFHMGLTHDLPNDAQGQEHVVFFMDSEAAANVENIAWGTVFAGLPPEHTYTEETIIQAIHGFTEAPDQATFDAAAAIINDFKGYTIRHARVGAGGTEGSMVFGPGEDFTIMAFSDGSIGGSGTSTWGTELQTVPEPSALAVLGMGALALYRRRR